MWPGLGPETTLVITDVQDSTTLFESLPVNIIDEAMQLAAGITRKAMLKHKGYESATEGDSFIIAFHTARDAALFCVELQSTLLSAPWPSQLLTTEGVASVHPHWVASTPHAETCTQVMKGVYTAGAAIEKEQSISRLDNALIQAEWWWPKWFKTILAGRLRRQVEESCATGDAQHLKYMTADAARASASPIAGKELLDMLTTGCASMADSDPASQELYHFRASPLRLGSRENNLIPAGDYPSVFRNPLAGQLHPSVDLPTVSETSTCFLRDLMGQAWLPCEAPTGRDANHELLWAGLRVRCGVASGLTNSRDAIYNNDTHSTQYGGSFLAAAKLMEACANGGQVVLSSSTFSLLDRKHMPEDVLVLHLGKHLVQGEAVIRTSATGVMSPEARYSNMSLDPFMNLDDVCGSAHGMADFTLNPMGPGWHHLYTVMHVRNAPRLAALPTLKVAQSLVNGVLDAPLGAVTIAFLTVVGVPALRDWDADKTQAAMVVFASIAKQHLRHYGGYLVEHVEGFMLTSFHCPLAALRWAIAVQSDMMRAPWSPGLLKQALAEELHVTHVDQKGRNRNVVLFRGPRIKVGMSSGMTKSEVHASTGRMAYRGKVMNRAARIAATANSGQVLCNRRTWDAAVAVAGRPEGDMFTSDLRCVRLGGMQLKGIKEKVEICQVQRHSNGSARNYIASSEIHGAVEQFPSPSEARVVTSDSQVITL